MDKRQEYKNMYLRERVDEIKVRVPKGQKAIIQEYAKSKGKSCNRFIIDLIETSSKFLDYLFISRQMAISLGF